MTSPQLVGQEPSLSTLVQMRLRTDIEIPIAWLLLPLASYLLWAVFAIAWWSGGAGLGTSDLTLVISGLGTLGLAASAAGSYLVFRLVNRANEHSSRTRALLLSALSALEARVGISGTQALLPLNSAEEGFNKLAGVERERSAVLWAFVLGAAGALILVYLTIGAFSLFWIDLSIRDPTGHFHYHSQLEADILRVLPDGTSTSAGVA